MSEHGAKPKQQSALACTALGNAFFQLQKPPTRKVAFLLLFLSIPLFLDGCLKLTLHLGSQARRSSSATSGGTAPAHARVGVWGAGVGLRCECASVGGDVSVAVLLHSKIGHVGRQSARRWHGGVGARCGGQVRTHREVWKGIPSLLPPQPLLTLSMPSAVTLKCDVSM